MKWTFAFFIISTVMAEAQPSFLSIPSNFNNYNGCYIPIEIQKGFVLDSVRSSPRTAGAPDFNAAKHYQYNANGQLIWDDDWGAVADSSYRDKFGHSLVEYWLGYPSITYDEKGLISEMNIRILKDSSWIDIDLLTYTYDSNNRILSKVDSGLGGSLTLTTTHGMYYKYDSLGNLISCHDTLTSFDYSSWSIMEYDSLSRTKRMNNIQQNGCELYLFDYDSVGNAYCTIIDSFSTDGINQIDTLQLHRIEYNDSHKVILDVYGADITTDTSSLYNGKVECAYDPYGKILNRHSYVYWGSSYGWDDNGQSSFSYDSDNNLNSCSIMDEQFNQLAPTNVVLYDHYGNTISTPISFTDFSYTEFYYSNLSSSGVLNSRNVPTDFSLNQNYPNPFNPTTVIGYQLPAVSNVSLKIYDVLGREVATLVDGRQKAGSYSVTFRADKLPSGVYFYSIVCGNFHQVKKMVLIK